MKRTSIPIPALSLLCAALVGPAFAGSMPVIYPAKGQTAEQTDRDKFVCFDWSRRQSGFDPMQSPPPAPRAQAQAPGSAAAAAADPGVSGIVKGAAGGAAVAELTHGDAAQGAAIGVLGAGLRERARQQQAQQQQASQQQQQRAQQEAALAQGRARFERGFAACMEARGYVVK